ncbi:chemotaxis protein CheW [Crateriforma conspicua]|uniref:histidine kinase n=1 Tax=Crateriforma conspicua TaxID=2527996 RepID=A0A5C6FPT1_9PLAN|nr:chemotaxis protein CheW [Crateriforma conspicua]TWU63294.1 Chemotaxis protein CheA [Crateriforma conspicua]
MNDGDLVAEFVEEAREHLGCVEMQLLQIEALGADINDDLVNTVFRSIHSVKGAAGFLGLNQINQVAHRLENVLGRVRDHQLVPDPFNVDVMLKAADRLSTMIEDIDQSNATDNAELCEKLDQLLADAPTETPVEAEQQSAPDEVVVQDDDAETEAEIQADVEAKPASGRRKSTRRKTSTRKKASPRKKAAGAAKADQAANESVDADASKADTDEKDRDAAKGAETMLETASTGVAAAASAGSKRGAKAARGADGKPSGSSSPEASIRVGVRVLDRLMNLAGELVLSRNQLLRVLAQQGTDTVALDSIASGLDQVTTELQETIMQTRMQPIGNVFNKFPRVVRDLASSLNKSIDLQMEGTEVETDKTIVEAIADPLTHLVRNSCDHGIETPEVREAAGKPSTGTVLLRAYHQAGKVMIEIRDDGAGMDPDVLRNKAVEKGVISADAASRMSDRDAVNLIFAPGFSTAGQVTDVSGRGVGMDVVRTNIENIGGNVEVESELGRGSVIRITLPLTLAIVPSMIVSLGERRYALPQTNIVELVQTDGKEKRIDHVGNAEVLHLRGALIPLVRLADILSLPPAENSEEPKSTVQQDDQIVVVESGRVRFALAVDRVLDSEEIVVKPLGRHLANLPLLAGSTILGDGRVAMILDAAGIAGSVQLSLDAESQDDRGDSQTDGESLIDKHRMVLLSVSQDDHFALPMDIVSRIERVAVTDIDNLGSQMVLKYRGGTLPLVTIDSVVSVTEVDQTDTVHVIVFKVYGHEAGLVAPHLNDICECSISLDSDRGREPGVAGITVIEEQSTRLLDLYGLTELARPEWFEGNNELDADRPAELLVCEDSAFFRNFLVRFLEDEGHNVTSCEDGEEGWITLNENPQKYDLLVTDVEMPELDGIELTRRIRGSENLSHLPVIALTSLADEASTKRGFEAGVSDYQVKMNKPELKSSIQTQLSKVFAK